MSAQNIPLELPNPFHLAPSSRAVPISRTVHVPAVQTLNSGSTGALVAGQCVAPFILNYSATATGAFTLPDAFSLSQAFGNSSISTTISNQIPGFGQIPSTQVQVGDVFAIPVYVVSSSTQGAVFSAGTGGTGTKPVAAYSTSVNSASLEILWTAVGSQLSQCAYTLQ